MIPQNVLDYRKQYKNSLKPRYYSGFLHFSFELLIGFLTIFYSLFQINFKALEYIHFLIFPIGFVLANFVEYLAHRFPLHRPFFLMKIAYQEHTIKHHHYFTDQAIELESTQDFHRILFPWFGVVFFVLGIGGFISLVASAILDANSGYLFLMTSVLYFLSYETIHLICHLPDNHIVFKIRIFYFLKKHHQSHHALNLMSHHNFGVVTPLFDWVFGTLRKN